MFEALFGDWPNIFQGTAATVVAIAGTWLLAVGSVRRAMAAERRSRVRTVRDEMRRNATRAEDHADAAIQRVLMFRLAAQNGGLVLPALREFWGGEAAALEEQALRAVLEEERSLAREALELHDEDLYRQCYESGVAGSSSAALVAYAIGRESGSIDAVENLNELLDQVRAAARKSRKGFEKSLVERPLGYQWLVRVLRWICHPIRSLSRADRSVSARWKGFWAEVHQNR